MYLNLLACKKTSNWSTQLSLSSANVLSFFTKATTYLARAPESASHLKNKILNYRENSFTVYVLNDTSKN